MHPTFIKTLLTFFTQQFWNVDNIFSSKTLLFNIFHPTFKKMLTNMFEMLTTLFGSTTFHPIFFRNFWANIFQKKVDRHFFNKFQKNVKQHLINFQKNVGSIFLKNIKWKNVGLPSSARSGRRLPAHARPEYASSTTTVGRPRSHCCSGEGVQDGSREGRGGAQNRPTLSQKVAFYVFCSGGRGKWDWVGDRCDNLPCVALSLTTRKPSW